MEWVLFVIWITFNGDTGAMTADFNSKGACDDGAGAVETIFSARFFVTEISARCVPKGTELLAPKIRKNPIGDR